MDYYNGAGVDITYMGIGELGEDGSVNSTKMGVRVQVPVDLLILHKMLRK